MLTTSLLLAPAGFLDPRFRAGGLRPCRCPGHRDRATRRTTTTSVPVGRGAAEVRALEEPYGRIAAERQTVVRPKTNDNDMAIDAQHPAHLVITGQDGSASPPHALGRSA
ncbi:hypothetical protein QMZ92_01460 [Streptomyces sp. HNM0645]|uniref:hypothetical protein n=1 Tax=Streptomyces sp. HNM0645 TaxID=2782343 RepID=UPI0024B64A31|nr:hypothetical protein [Streptomyces sp. HNM0645]MDI9883100.1 hypothetical protein [Streptomyces sp. HNM0645]